MPIIIVKAKVYDAHDKPGREVWFGFPGMPPELAMALAHQWACEASPIKIGLLTDWHWVEDTQ